MAPCGGRGLRGGRPPEVGHRSIRRLIAVFVLVAVMPLAVLAYTTTVLSSRAVTSQARSMVEVATSLEAGAVSGLLAGFVDLCRSIATRPSLVADLEPSAKGGSADADDIQIQLDGVTQNDPQLAFASVVDPAGRIIAASPSAAAQRGTDFSYRDWYHGVRRSGAPYVSPAFLSTLGDTTVAVSAPIRTPAGAAAPAPVIGYVNLGYRIDAIQSEITRLAAGQRMPVTVTDQAGMVIAAPDRSAGLIPAAGDPRVRRALAGEAGTMFAAGPRGRVLSGYAPVGRTGWTVHADLPEELALARVRSLRSAVLAWGAVLGIILVVALGLLARAWRQRATALEAEHRSAVQARIMLETSLDPMVTIAPDGEITNVNQATVRATGVPRGRLIGSSFAGYFTDPEKASAGYRRAYEHGHITDYPLDLRHASGKIIEVVYNANVYRDESGHVIGVFAAARDVTERNKAERTAREQAHRLAAMVAATPDGFCRFDTDGRFLQVSDAYCQMSGHTREQLLLMHIHDVEAWEEPQQVSAHIAAVGRIGFDRFESRHRRKDGTVLDVEVSASPSGDGQFVAFVRDITDRKRAEQTAGRLAAVVNASDDAITIESPEGEVLTWNPGAEHLYGYRAEEMVGHPVSTIVPVERHAETTANLRRAGGGERVSHVETVRLTKEGAVVDVSLSLSPLRDTDGNVTGVCSIARDITALKRYQRELHGLNAELERRVRERTAELERANEDLRSFTYSVSHDLRAPLLGLTGFTRLLLEDYGDCLDDAGRDYGRRIQAAAERMGRLIDDLLQLSRVGRADIHLEDVDLSAEVANVADELCRANPDRNVQVAIERGVHAQVDRRLIRTVIENLLGNAWKFTAGHEVAIVEFGTAPAGEAALCCYVRDNGVGFDQSHADRVFEPFQRLHAIDEYPGTGVGLASVRRVIERHHGNVWAQSTVGHGATFYFTLDAAGRS